MPHALIRDLIASAASSNSPPSYNRLHYLYQIHSKHILQSYSIHPNLTLQSLLFIQYCHLALICIDFKTSSTHQQNVPPLALQEASWSPLSPFYHKSYSNPPHPLFHLFHHCVHIPIEEPRGYDATLSYTTVNPETLTLTPFYLYTG